MLIFKSGPFSSISSVALPPAGFLKRFIWPGLLLTSLTANLLFACVYAYHRWGWAGVHCVRPCTVSQPLSRVWSQSSLSSIGKCGLSGVSWSFSCVVEKPWFSISLILECVAGPLTQTQVFKDLNWLSTAFQIRTVKCAINTYCSVKAALLSIPAPSQGSESRTQTQ